jgi:uncharacterized SAM-binding protein YcdF (DUF218 family)
VATNWLFDLVGAEKIHSSGLSYLAGGAILLILVASFFVAPGNKAVSTLWQVASFPLKPLGGVITLLGVALANGIKKIDGRLVLIALGILLVSSTPLVALILVDQSEHAVQRAYESQKKLCDDICKVDQVPLTLAKSMVILGDNADMGLASSLPSQIDAEVDLDPMLVSRLNSAAGVYRRIGGGQALVTVTAGALDSNNEQGKKLNNLIQQRLVASGIPAEKIKVNSTGMNMLQVIQDQKKFLQAQGLFTPPADKPDRQTERDNREANRVVLVAPALTMRRAALCFENAGLQVIAWPTELYSTPNLKGRDKLARLVDLVPNVAALRLTTRYWDELLTSIYYYLRGWLPSFGVQWDQVVETLP